MAKKNRDNLLFGTLKFNTLTTSVKVQFCSQILREASPISLVFIKSYITLRIHLSSSYNSKRQHRKGYDVRESNPIKLKLLHTKVAIIYKLVN